jgi:hypothetical protein
MVKRVNPTPSVPATPAKQNPNATDKVDKNKVDSGFKEVLDKVRGKSQQDVPDNYKSGGKVMATKPGLYANIAAKKRRIAAGSGEKMRPVGAKGAPTKQAFINSAKTAKIAKPAKRSARGR